MAYGSYVPGIQTFTAGEDIKEHRVVTTKGLSFTTPVEVILADAADSFTIGVAVTSAKQGELVSVKPWNMDGSFQIEASGYVTRGNKVYLSELLPGRVNDEATSFYIGEAISGATSAGEILEVIRTNEDLVTSAADVTIEDTAGYYSSGDVEGALAEVGGWNEAIDSTFNDVRWVRDFVPAMDLFRTDNGTIAPTTTIGAPLPGNWNGGLCVSNGSYAYAELLSGSSYPGYWVIRVKETDLNATTIYFRADFTLKHELTTDTGLSVPFRCKLLYSNTYPVSAISTDYRLYGIRHDYAISTISTGTVLPAVSTGISSEDIGIISSGAHEDYLGFTSFFSVAQTAQTGLLRFYGLDIQYATKLNY